MHETRPHGRDYYVQDDYAIGEALNEHDKRLRSLNTIREELEDLAHRCNEQRG